VKSNAEKQISQAVVVHSFRASTSFVNTASYRTGNLEFWPGHDQIEQFDSGVEVDCGSQSGKTQYGHLVVEIKSCSSPCIVRLLAITKNYEVSHSSQRSPA